ncbi:MAG: hypothetical protein HC906_06005 [Bacteroidales bacterium]|nr:hypothetical protein [Bacteroidales bacterium]
MKRSFNGYPREEWTRNEFENLSDLIYDASKIRVSLDTLRRLYGHKKITSSDYKPHPATKNALAQFLGYENWMEFVAKINKEQKTENRFFQNIFPFFRKDYTLIFIVSIVLIGLSIFLGFFFFKTGKEKVEFSASSFEGYPPHTVNFSYDISNIQDSVYLQFDEPNKTKVLLNEVSGTISHSFIIPKIYHIQLLKKRRESSFGYKN